MILSSIPRKECVERIKFDSEFWEKRLLPKLTDFYKKCIAPEIVSPMHALGQPIRDLRNKDTD